MDADQKTFLLALAMILISLLSWVGYVWRDDSLRADCGKWHSGSDNAICFSIGKKS